MYFINKTKRRKLFYISLIAIALGFASTLVAHLLLTSINFFTNLFYYGKFSLDESIPTSKVFGNLIFFLPPIGGLIAGIMARFGSPAIRGHGIPEAMDTILNKQSKIPRRLIFLKPISSAIVIGSGGPFGAEGPIIATGAAVGSFFGQFMPKISEQERKTLLACGAAAGMTAIFGTPLAAIFLCIELLLFEFSPKTFIPVAISVSIAQALRFNLSNHEAIFSVDLSQVLINGNMAFYILTGAIAGFASCFISKSIFLIEDLFEKLPIHWMWWPLIGGIVVGAVGLYDERTLGVGYYNIINSLNNNIGLQAALSLLVLKYISWAFSLGSGTSGGTLAPILTLGSSFGLIFAQIGIYFFPNLNISPELCALVAMASMFSGATRAVLTSIIFALETTNSSVAAAPLIAGCSSAYLISLLFLKETIMTEKIKRKGGHVPSEYYPLKNKV